MVDLRAKRRAEEELMQLRSRVQRLEHFLGLESNSVDVGEEQATLMYKQLDAMKAYECILSKRMEIWT